MRILCTAFLMGMLACTNPAWALVVPDADCPTAFPDREQLGLEIGCDVQHECNRTDGAPANGAAGTASVKAGGSHTCANCAGCPSNPPSALICIQALTVTHTCEVSVSVGSTVTVSAEVVEASLTQSIGFTNGQSVSRTINCGTETYPACKKNGSYEVTMNIVTGKTKTIAHTYQWKITPNPNCNNTAVSYHAGGSDTSTVTGTVPDGEATCRSKDPSVDC